MDANYSIEEMLESLSASNIKSIRKILNSMSISLTRDSIRSDTSQADVIYRS